MRIICQRISKKQLSSSSRIARTADHARMRTVGATSPAFPKATVPKGSPSSSSLPHNRTSPTPRTPSPRNTRRTAKSRSKCACSKTTPSPTCPPTRPIRLRSSSSPSPCPCPSRSSILGKTTCRPRASQSLAADSPSPAHSCTRRASSVRRGRRGPINKTARTYKRATVH